MSAILNLPNVILSLPRCEVGRSRDGFTVRTPDRHVVQVSTRFADESAILAVLESICLVLRERGAEAEATAALAAREERATGVQVDFSPPEVEIDSLRSALPIPAPTPPPAPPAPAPAVVKRRGRGKG